MRIAIDYTSAVRQRAGIGRFTRDQVGAMLAATPDRDWTLVVTRDAEAAPPAPNARIARLPLDERAWLAIQHRLPFGPAVERFIGGFDVYHGPNFLLPRLRAAWGVATIHDLTFLVHPEFAEPSLAAFLRRAVPQSIRRAAAICADSETTKRDLAERLGVPGERVTVVRGGVRPIFRPVAPEDARAALPAAYPVDRPFIFALGTREPRKNLGGLLQAYQSLRARGLDPRLLLAGPEGWRMEGFAEQIARSPYRDDVVSLGFVEDEQLPALLSLCDCFVYPSFYEGFGLPVLEAMACGAPVVCSDRASVAEIAGAAASLAPPDEPEQIAMAIERVLRDTAHASALRAAGPPHAAAFTWERSARELLNVYEGAVA
jgi:glycosyltransferase involved in cell wall biosynthesis